MSRAYRVTWVNVSGSVTTSDTLTMPVELLPILAPARMADLLRDELCIENKEWTRNSDGSMSLRVNDTTATLDPETAKVTITADAKGDVAERGVNAADAEQNLERGKVKLKEHLTGELARQLTDAEATVRTLLQAAIQRAYVRALKEKAASMGTVTSIDEGPEGGGDYVVTIKVRV